MTRSVEINHEFADDDGYQRWIRDFETRDPELLRMKIERLPERPVISLVTPVYRTDPKFLRRAIESVLAQSYPHWELCLADDASEDPQVEMVLREYSRRTPGSA